MSFAIDVNALRERASKRVATVATVATLLPEQVSKVAAVAGLQQSNSQSNPLMTVAQANECHSPGWSDAEIDTFNDRRDRLLRWGYQVQDADSLAERLTLRDRESDERSMCVECSFLSPTGRCLSASLGRLPGAPRRLEPMTTLLQRCEGFQRSKPSL